MDISRGMISPFLLLFRCLPKYKNPPISLDFMEGKAMISKGIEMSVSRFAH